MEKLTQAIHLIKTGEKAKGRKFLAEVIRSEPRNETAWLWMTAAVDSKDQRKQCLEKVLDINPNNEQARAGLSKMMGHELATSVPKPIEIEDNKGTDYAVEPDNVYTDENRFRTNVEAPGEVQIDRYALQARIEALQNEQDYALGILGGLFGGGIGAVLWAMITYFTEFQIGFMAVGVGFLVGYGVGFLGKGIEKIYGITGGMIALFSVGLGNFLASIGFLAKVWEVGYLEALWSFNYAMTFELMAVAFSPIDIVFYAIAIYEGYLFSFRKINREELLRGVAVK